MTADARPASGRQVIRFSTIDEVLRIADVIYRSGSTPRDCDRPEKIALMLIAGAEVGFGVAQTMECVLPPVNGRCTLYGDAGLSLIRASGLLEQFDERVEGDGDDRKAVVTIQRRGYPVKAFEYTTALAKKLRSFKKAEKDKQGPWFDDPDNMLTWRARWRAFRTEFTDVLHGMSGVEEMEDEAITVEATARPLPASPPPAALPPAAAATEQQLEEISRLRHLVREHLPDANQQKEVWSAALTPFGVESAKALTPDQADRFIRAVGEKYDPFTYPPASTT